MPQGSLAPPPAPARAAGSPASGSKVVYGIQILRGVAAMLVVFRHAAKELAVNRDEAFAVGQCGVDIFFVISGFVIYLTGRGVPWSVFLRRRIARIVPMYWLVLALVIAGRIVSQGVGFHYLAKALASFLFIPIDAYPPIVVGWTLNFEAYFYLLMAVSLAFLPKRDAILPVTVMILAGIAIGPVALGLFRVETTPPAVLLLPITLEFLGGMWLAKLWSTGRIPPSWPWAIALITAAIIWFAIAPWAKPYTPARPIIWGIPALAAVLGTLMLERRIDFSRWRWPLVLGDASYSLYLVHLLIFGVLVSLVPRTTMPIALYWTMLVVAAVIIGVAVHYFVELPLLKLANRLLGLRKGTGSAGADSAHIR